MVASVLITGAAGALGRCVAAQLRQAGIGVVSCGRVQGGGIDAIWDIAVEDRPTGEFAPEVMVHAAALTAGYQESLDVADRLMAVNVTGTLRVARWASEQGAKRLVLISGAIVYGEWAETPKSEEDRVAPWCAGPYAVSKWCSEQVARILEQSACELTILRLSSLYGASYRRGLIQRIIEQARLEGRVVLRAPFDDKFDLMHVADAARIVHAAVEAKQSGLWNAGGMLLDIQALAKACTAEVGVPLVLDDAMAERPARIINWVDDRKARDELGHVNLVSLAEGISEIFAEDNVY